MSHTLKPASTLHRLKKLHAYARHLQRQKTSASPDTPKFFCLMYEIRLTAAQIHLLAKDIERQPAPRQPLTSKGVQQCP